MHNLIVSINPDAWLTAFAVLIIAAGFCFFIGVIAGMISLDGGCDGVERGKIRHFMRCALLASAIMLPCAIFSAFAEHWSEDCRKEKAAAVAAYAELSQRQ